MAHIVQELFRVAKAGFALVMDALDASMAQLCLAIVHEDGEQEGMGLSHVVLQVGQNERQEDPAFYLWVRIRIWVRFWCALRFVGANITESHRIVVSIGGAG